MYDWEITGLSLTYLAIECIGYLCLVFAIEILSHSPFLMYVWNNLTKSTYIANYETSLEMLDNDVKKERNYLQNNKASETDLIQIKGIRKVYPRTLQRDPIVAVQNLWYRVPKGEVFGFLGINGKFFDYFFFFIKEL